MTGNAVDARAVVDRGSAARSGVEHAETLLAFADAVVGDDEAELERARAAVIEQLGPEQLVDAAAVASNFERMVRIADATGIPLDTPLDLMSQDLREQLDLNRFGAAAKTHTTAAQRLLGTVIRPVANAALRLIGKLQRARA